MTVSKDDKLRQAIGRHLGKLIDAAGGDQAVAAKIGSNRATVTYWGNGDRFPAPEWFEPLAAALLPPGADWRGIFPPELR